MNVIKETIEQLRSMKVRQVSPSSNSQLILQAVNFALVVSSALMIWRSCMLAAGNESPAVVVLSGSMEPSMYRGDILILWKFADIEIGDTVVYKIPNEQIPIVHRISSIQKVKGDDGASKTLFLTKGDNNPVDDRGLYPRGVSFLETDAIVGHVVASIPYSGYLTLLLNDYPYVKYGLCVVIFINFLVSKDPQ